MPGPDPKRSTHRIVDHPAIVAAKIRHPWCAACGQYGGNGHHVLPKDRGGDDVESNIVVLCGSGTSGCHGAHHGSPYLVDVNEPAGVCRERPLVERRDAEWVNRRVGEHLLRERPDVIDYILTKLDVDQGRNFLADTYRFDLPIE